MNTLLLVVRIKAECKKACIARLDAGPKGATIQFHNDKFPNPEGLVEFIQEQRGLAKVKDNKIIVRRDWKKDSDKIKGAFAIARDLAAKAKAEGRGLGLIRRGCTRRARGNSSRWRNRRRPEAR